MSYRLKDENKQIRDMFSRIARRYDLLNRILSARQDVRWRRTAVSHVHPREGGVHLDLACGTGDVGIEIAMQTRNSFIVGADISGEMLELALNKVRRKEFEDRFSFVTCAGEELPFLDETFDTVSIAFGIRNIVERRRALREIHRVLKPGGKLIILEFSLPKSKLIGKLYFFYFTKLLPFLGGVFSERSAYTYLPDSVMKFPPPEEFARMMEESGFSNVAITALSFGIVRLYVGEKD